MRFTRLPARAGRATNRLAYTLLALSVAVAACGGSNDTSTTASPVASFTVTRHVPRVNAPTATASPTVAPTPAPTRAPRDPAATVPIFTSNNDGVSFGIDPCTLLDAAEIASIVGLATGSGDEGGDAATCVWTLGRPSSDTSVTLSLLTRLAARERVTVAADPVTLGDQATWDGTSLLVFRGELAFDLVIATGASAEARRTQALELGEIVLSRLP